MGILNLIAMPATSHFPRKTADLFPNAFHFSLVECKTQGITLVEWRKNDTQR